ncbi:MAG: outer membrane beta-barrel protein [Steroidobacteraceae bacterium]
MARQSRALLATISLMACAGAANAQSGWSPLGFYVGAGLGDATPQGTVPGAFVGCSASGHQLGWDAFGGIRPIPWMGAEVQYLDFGHTRLGPSSPAVCSGLTVAGEQPDILYGGEQQSRAVAAFAVGYLPLPWQSPWLDLFGKVGAAQTWTSAHYSVIYSHLVCAGTSCPMVGPPMSTFTSHETYLAYGGGLQVHFGSFAVRAEYVTLDSKFGNPALLSIGVTWTP